MRGIILGLGVDNKCCRQRECVLNWYGGHGAKFCNCTTENGCDVTWCSKRAKHLNELSTWIGFYIESVTGVLSVMEMALRRMVSERDGGFSNCCKLHASNGAQFFLDY